MSIAIIDKRTGDVVNIGTGNTAPKEDDSYIYKKSSVASIGDKYDFDNNKYIKPEPVIPVLPYNVMREQEYPALGDQLDAIWKQLNYDRLNGRELIQEADDILNEILAVKAKYPKE